MQTKSIRYEKCFNLGDYEHEKIAVEVEVDPEDNVQEVIKQARNYVELQSKPFQQKYDRANKVVNNPDDYTGHEVKTAQLFLDSINGLSTPEITHMSESKVHGSTPRPF